MLWRSFMRVPQISTVTNTTTPGSNRAVQAVGVGCFMQRRRRSPAVALGISGSREILGRGGGHETWPPDVSADKAERQEASGAGSFLSHGKDFTQSGLEKQNSGRGLMSGSVYV